MGRALRYIRVGQHVRRQEVFFSEELEALLRASRECASDRPQAAKGSRRRRHRHHVLVGEEDMFMESWADRHEAFSHHGDDANGEAETSSPTKVVETLTTEEQEKIERFLKYHLHHVVVSFKQKRKALQAQDRHTKGATATAVSPEAVRAVTDYILYASLLLHLSALFGFSGSGARQQQMIEKLIQTVFSCSIFLSQFLRQSRAGGRGRQQQKRRNATYHDKTDSFGGFFQRLTPTCTNSLHWGVLHFCEGVRLWELQRHQYALQPLRLSPVTGGSGGGGGSGDRREAAPRDPYHVLLQTHARLVLALLPRDAPAFRAPPRKGEATCPMPPALQSALVLLAGNDATQAKTHAILKWMGEYEAAEDPTTAAQEVRELRYQVGDAITTPRAMRVQSRRLQLLPLFWTALVAYGIVHQPPPLHPSHSEAPPPPMLSMRAARHAFRAVVPLFRSQDSQEGDTATVEPSFFYLLTLLYACPLSSLSTSPASLLPCHESSMASPTELLALLAILEKHHVLRPQLWQTQHILSQRPPTSGGAAAKDQRAFVRQNFVAFFNSWFRQRQRQQALRDDGDAAHRTDDDDLVKLKGKREMYLSLSTMPFSLVVVPSLAAAAPSRAGAYPPPPAPKMWRTLGRELQWLYTAALLRHLAQWSVCVPLTRPRAAGGSGASTTLSAPPQQQQQQQQQQDQRAMVAFVEALEVTLKAVMRLVRLVHYKQEEAVEAAGEGAPFGCLLEKQLLRLIAFQLGADDYPRRLREMAPIATSPAPRRISTHEKELMLAIHRCLMSVFGEAASASTAAALSDSASAPLHGCCLPPGYVEHLHLLLRA